MKKHVILLIPHVDYSQTEYEQIKQTLTDKNIDIKTASTMKGTAAAYTPDSYVVAEDKKTTTHVDMLIDTIDPLKWDGIFFIGGPGALQDCNIPSVHQLMHDAHNFDKPLGAIGQATRILAEAGVLKNKEATGWNDDGKLDTIYAHHGAQNLHESVVTDGNIITATGETAAKQFANAIITCLDSE